MSQTTPKRRKSVALRHLKDLVKQVDKVDYSEHWIKKMRNIFRLNDLENTGYASRRGLNYLAEQIMVNTGMSDEDAKETKRILDEWGKDTVTDPDAKLPFDEFLKVRYVMVSHPDLKQDFKGFTDELATVWFNVIDTNHNGVISDKEWRTFFKCIKFDDPAIADTAFKAVDINEDGVLSKEEFVTGFFDYVCNQEKGRYDSLFGPLPKD